MSLSLVKKLTVTSAEDEDEDVKLNFSNVKLDFFTFVIGLFQM